MKKNLLLSALLLIVAMVAQSQNDTLKSNRWEIGITYNSVEAQLNQFVIDGWGRYAYSNLTNYFGDQKNRSVSLSLLPKYKLNDQALVRCELGFTNIYLTSYYYGINDSIASGTNQNLLKQDTIQQKIFRLTPGIQLNFNKYKRIQSYGVLSANFIFYDKSYWKDNLKNTTTSDYDRWVGSTPGGFALGIGTAAGFNVFLMQKIIVTAEMSAGLVYYKVGGVQTGMRYVGPNSTLYPRAWSVSNNVSTGFQFTKPMPSLGISFLF